jgi:hypothetical protein
MAPGTNGDNETEGNERHHTTSNSSHKSNPFNLSNCSNPNSVIPQYLNTWYPAPTFNSPNASGRYLMLSVAALKRVLLGLLLIAGLAISGCGGGGGGGSLPNPTIRFFNGVSDSTSLDFLLDDTVEAPQLGYLASTPNFDSVESKLRDLRVLEDGTTVDLWSETIALEKDKHYLISSIGIENYGTETLKRVRTLALLIDRTAPNGSRAKLFVIHGYNREAGLETPAIDFQTPGDNPQFSVRNIDYATAKTLDVDAGTLTFQARRNGTETVLVSNTVTLGGGKIYAAYVLGVENASGTQAPRIEFVELQTK